MNSSLVWATYLFQGQIIQVVTLSGIHVQFHLFQDVLTSSLSS